MEQEAQDSIDMNMLYEAAVLGDWHTVVRAYTSSSSKIIDGYNAAGAENDTALHVAVVTANNETEHVSEIIGVIPKDNLSEILRMRNHWGNTPLHLAAAVGSVEVCWRIASKDKSLIAERNEEGETPLFLAARRGHEKAFFFLENSFGKKDISMNILMNSNRDTILHSAIYGQHYGFAIQIVESYPHLVDHMNNENLTPLHVLALQPGSFKSSTADLGLFYLIFYHCIIIRRHTCEDQNYMKDIEEIVRSRNSQEHPPNYETCCDIYNIFKRMFFCIFGHGCSSYKSNTEADGGRTSLEGGNRRQIRMETEDGPSTTICDLILRILKFIPVVSLHFLGSGGLLSMAGGLLSMVKWKREHMLAEQLLNELLDKARFYKLSKVKAPSTSSTSKIVIDAPSKGAATSTPGKEKVQEQQSSEPFARGETPLLTAVRLEIVEMVDAILNKFPGAIQDKDCQGKNVVLLAAETRNFRLYRLLEKKTMVKESIFRQVDASGNSALHLASWCNPDQRWFTPGPVLQLKREIIWHMYVESSMPSNFFTVRNKDRKTAGEIFFESHTPLRKEAKDWVTKICTSYSVISTLIAAAALATSLNIPGGYNHGLPEFESELAFSFFSISSVVALCTSMSALVFFMAILTTPDTQAYFVLNIPSWLQLGLMFLFASIASMLVSFSSSFYFSVRSKLEHTAYPIFAVMCLPVILFAAVQLPLFLSLSDYKIRHPRQDTGTH